MNRRITSCHRILVYIVLLAIPCLLLGTTMAFPKNRPVANKTRFSRERVKLQGGMMSDSSDASSSSSSSAAAAAAAASTTSPKLISRETLIKFDILVGILYSIGFFLFPGKTLSLFFEYEFHDDLQAFLHMMVRMIAINHLGYIGGLITSPPEKAIKVATAFLTIGGAFVVYYGQAKLQTAAAFWSCTILTTAMILAHLLAL